MNTLTIDASSMEWLPRDTIDNTGENVKFRFGKGVGFMAKGRDKPLRYLSDWNTTAIKKGVGDWVIFGT
jgi:hypothetical protein